MNIFKNKSLIHSPILVILSGAASALAMTFTSLDFLIWFSFIPAFFFFSLNTLNKKETFKYMYLYGLTYNSILLYWLLNLHPLTWKGFSVFESILIVIGAYVGLFLFESLFYGILGFITSLFKPQNKYVKGLLFLTTIIIIEWLRNYSILGFPWGKIAISQYKNIRLIQTASLFGISFVSFIILIFNYTLFITIINYKKKNYIKSFVAIMCAIIIFSGNFLYGNYSINKDYSSNESLNVAIIQGNISVSDKWREDNLRLTKEKYFSLTKQALEYNENIDMIFWPETAIPINFSNKTSSYYDILNFNKEIDLPLFTGGFRTSKSNNFHNSIYLIEDGKVIDYYDKAHPVPFGEFIPFLDVAYKYMPNIFSFYQPKEHLTASKEVRTINYRNFVFGPLVCYDSIFPDLSVKSVKNGSNILYVASNDSWYKYSKALNQHHAQSVFRAIENRKYLIRAANTGLSSIISPLGGAYNLTKPETEAIVIGKIHRSNTISYYTKHKNLFPLFIILIHLFLLLFSLKKPRTH